MLIRPSAPASIIQTPLRLADQDGYVDDDITRWQIILTTITQRDAPSRTVRNTESPGAGTGTPESEALCCMERVPRSFGVTKTRQTRHHTHTNTGGDSKSFEICRHTKTADECTMCAAPFVVSRNI